MSTQSSPSAVRFTSHCPKPRTFQHSAEKDLLLRRTERAVDQIVESLACLASAKDVGVKHHALRLAAATRRLADLAARWQRLVSD